jgi:hypothetical protein
MTELRSEKRLEDHVKFVQRNLGSALSSTPGVSGQPYA